MTTRVYVGTYTRPAPYLAETNGKGIYVYEMDEATGALTALSETGGIDNPSFIAPSADGRHLYATSEVWGWHEGLITAYAIDPTTGALRYLNQQTTHGSICAQVNTEPEGRYVFMVNYWEGAGPVMFPLLADGRLAPASDLAVHSGNSIDPQRQDKPHPHCIVLNGDNTRVYVCDLGIDRIMIYQIDWARGRFVANDPPFCAMPPGSGPRHFAFHPNGEYAYCTHELSASVSAFRVGRESGGLTRLHTVSTLPEGWKGESHCSDLHVTRDGKFLYAGNRGHDSLSIFRIGADGTLTLIGHQMTGKTPRNFNIDPSDTFLLCANQDSDTLVSYRIDHETGLLAETAQADVPTPVCVQFVKETA